MVREKVCLTEFSVVFDKDDLVHIEMPTIDVNRHIFQ